MATCPRCRGYLTDNHRCRRRTLVTAGQMLVWGAAGAFSGLLLVALFDPHGQITDLESASAIAGALLGVGLGRALKN